MSRTRGEHLLVPAMPSLPGAYFCVPQDMCNQYKKLVSTLYLSKGFQIFRILGCSSESWSLAKQYDISPENSHIPSFPDRPESGARFQIPSNQWNRTGEINPRGVLRPPLTTLQGFSKGKRDWRQGGPARASSQALCPVDKGERHGQDKWAWESKLS